MITGSLVGVASPPASAPFPQPLPRAVPQTISPVPPPTIPGYYSSTTHRTTVTADNGNQITVADATQLPAAFPFKLLLNWGAASQEVVVAMSPAGGNVLNVARAQDGTAQQTQPVGATVDHGVSAAEFNMLMSHVQAGPLAHGEASLLWAPSTALPPGQYVGQEVKTQDTFQRLLWNGSQWEPGLPVHAHTVTANDGGTLGIASATPAPGYWSLYGHSYFAQNIGTTWSTGRADAYLRQLLGLSYSNWRNYAVLGANLTVQGIWTGGWTRPAQTLVHPVPAGQSIHGAPFYPDTGGVIFCWGINDIGGLSGTQAAIRTAFNYALTASISRARSSTVYLNNSTTGGVPTYGAGFVQVTGAQDYASGTTVRQATALTNANFTITLPSSYAGEPVAIQFSAMPGVQGGTVTFSGTAGVTGTLNLSGVAPAGPNSHLPVIQRITNLTSANAGQTVICTVTALDPSGQVNFDCWWLESTTPAPVIVCNVPRIQANGYAGYANGIGDPDVVALNAVISTVVAQFDAMVQIADLDGVLNKNPLYFASDGLHPNERGASFVAQALLTAISKLIPTTKTSPALIAQSSPQSAFLRVPHISGNWYTTPAAGASTITAPTAGNLYALPFVVTEAREMYNSLSLRLSTGGSVAGTVRLGLFDDPAWAGYPQNLVFDATNAGALNVGTTPGQVTTSSGTFNWSLDPGLWWLCWLQITAGTGQVYESVIGPDLTSVMPQLSSTAAPNGTPIAWLLTGQSTSGFLGDFPAGATVASNAPKLAIQKM